MPVCGTLPAKNSCFSGWRLNTSEPFLHWVWTTHIYQEHLLWWIDLLIPASPHPILLQSMETQWMYLVLVNMPWLSSFTMGRQRRHIMYFIVIFWHILRKVENSAYQRCNFQSLFTKSYILLHLFPQKKYFLLCSSPLCQEEPRASFRSSQAQVETTSKRTRKGQLHVRLSVGKSFRISFEHGMDLLTPHLLNPCHI